MSVDKQIKNRRENIVINDIPPEILTEAKLSADGYVKNTDYPTSSTAGVIKAATSYGTTVTSQGFLGAQTRTAAQYPGDANTLLVGKGTLENIKGLLVSGALGTIADALVDPPAAEGTVFKDLALVKGADGAWTITFLTVVPPETP